jgi:hypothetical protein
VAAFTGMSGCFKTEWVAALAWNEWSLWTGIRNYTQIKEYENIDDFANFIGKSVLNKP